MSKPIRLIAVDLDGTLLRDDKSVSAYTADIFAECARRGIATCVATARSENASARMHELVKPRALVTCGGALARLDGKVIWQKLLPTETAGEILRLAMGKKSVGRMQAETAGGHYYVSDEIVPGATGDYGHREHFDFRRTPLPEDLLKLLVQLEDDAERAEVFAAFPGLETHRYVNTPWAFFANGEATKWNGVLAVAGALGLLPEEVAAFGDDTADEEMLQKAGLGVAMANAIPQVKQAAGAVCPSNEEDGVARWIEENILS